MAEPLPIVLVPGLLASARLYGEQLPAPWRLGPVAIADPTRDHTMAAIARRILWPRRRGPRPGAVSIPIDELERDSRSCRGRST